MKESLNHICDRFVLEMHRQPHTHTHTAYLVTLQYSSSSQGLLTDLAYFLEVELWQGVEPVGQLSEVEKLHLEPGSERKIKGRRKCRKTDRQKESE